MMVIFFKIDFTVATIPTENISTKIKAITLAMEPCKS